jgi:hypothetical protein
MARLMRFDSSNQISKARYSLTSDVILSPCCPSDVPISLSLMEGSAQRNAFILRQHSDHLLQAKFRVPQHLVQLHQLALTCFSGKSLI